MYNNDEGSVEGGAGNENQNGDFTNANILDKKQLEVFKSSVDWEVESQRHVIFDQFLRLIVDWMGPLSDLRDIFQPEEIELLLLDSIDRRGTGQGENQAKRFIQFLIETGYKDKPKVDKDGKLMLRRRTALLCAFYKGIYRFDRELFKIYDRFDVNYIDERFGYTHFHVACAWGCTDVVAKFLELGRVDPNLLVTTTGNSPLQFALIDPELVELLLRNGANPNLANRAGVTVLHRICMHELNVEIAKMLLEYKPVEVDARDDRGFTPLLYAVDNANQAMVELLLRNGADPNLPNPEGYTPMHYAVHSADQAMVEFLLRNGANPNLPDLEGSTSLHVICDSASDDGKFFESFLKICKDTCKKLRIEARDNKGRTPLELAVENILPNTVDVLLKQGADLSSFVFPTVKQFDEINDYRKHVHCSKVRVASGLLMIVERLEKRGYELLRSDALTIMEFFTKYDLLASSDIEESWRDDERFKIEAKKIMIKPSLSLYDLTRLRPERAAKMLTYRHYSKLRFSKIMKIPVEFRRNCLEHLCEKLARRFFRRWTLYPFWERILHYRLPLLCCDMIMDNLKNKDLFNICLAATKQ